MTAPFDLLILEVALTVLVLHKFLLLFTWCRTGGLEKPGPLCLHDRNLQENQSVCQIFPSVC